MRCARLLLTVVLLLTAAFAEDWPKYLHDNSNTSMTSETWVSSANVSQLGVAWKFNTGKTISASPAVATINGTPMVFVGSWTGIFYALNANTGTKVWSYTTDKVGTCMLSVCPMIGSSAAVDNGVVYFGASNAYVYALNAATGSLIWKTQLGDPNAGYDIWSSPAVHNGLVFVGVGSHGDNPCVHGAVVALNASSGSVAWRFETLDETSCPTGTNCVGADVWTSAALDTVNNVVYIGTGNPGSTCIPSTANATRYPDSILALDMTTGNLLNYYQAVSNDTNDKDFGSSPLLSVTGTVNSCTGSDNRIRWVYEISKSGKAVFGKIGPGGFQTTPGTVTSRGAIASPGVKVQASSSACSATQNSTAYSANIFQPNSAGYLVNFAQSVSGTNSIAFNTSITSQYLFSAPAIVNDLVFYGSDDSYVRASRTDSGAVVWSYKTGARVDSGPAISNGMVYVGSGDGYLYAFTLSGTKVAATPTMSPVPGTYHTVQSVSLSDATTGASIYYTTDGTMPTTSSTLYTGTAIPVNTTVTINAIATASGYQNSSVASGTYNLVTATPTFSPAAGSYSSAQSVVLSDATPGASIYYTTNGTTPTTSSTLYTAAIDVSSTTTINAIAVASGFQNSTVASATYTINSTPQAAMPTFSPAPGSYSTAQSVMLSDATPGASIYYTTNGTTPTTSSTLYTSPISVSSSATIKAMAVASGYTNSAIASGTYVIGTTTNLINYSTFSTSTGMTLNNGAGIYSGNLWMAGGGTWQRRSAYFSTQVPIGSFTTDFDFQFTNAVGDGMTFIVQNSGLTAYGGANGGIGYGGGSPVGALGVAKSVAVKFDLYNNSGEGTNSTGLYTNGASPTVPATTITGVDLHSGDVLHAHITYDGTTLTLTLSDKTNSSVSPFTTSWPVNIPQIVGSSNAWVGFTASTGGTYAATETVLNWSYHQ